MTNFTYDRLSEDRDRFTVRGVLYKTLFLLLLLGGGVYAVCQGINWEELLREERIEEVRICCLIGVVSATLVGLGIVYQPGLAMYLAPVYALMEGGLLGLVVKVADKSYPGLPLNVLFFTIGTLLLLSLMSLSGMLVLGQRARNLLTTCCIMLFLSYGLRLLGWLLHLRLPAVFDDPVIELGINVFVLVVACVAYLDDFQRISELELAGAPSEKEWYRAFCLLVSIVWVYLRILKLFQDQKRRKGSSK